MAQTPYTDQQPYLNNIDPKTLKVLLAGEEDKPQAAEFARQQEMAQQLRGGGWNTPSTTQAGRVTVADYTAPLKAGIMGYTGQKLGEGALEGETGLAQGATGRREKYLDLLGQNKEDLLKQATGQGYGNQG